ncbi:MAG: glutamate--tRNA ligase [Candidatus Omnitrophica bacterium]|nr:glutamate--tRNA ligase [Candidatus Omnitrophota bacterium]
MTIRVRFAPSPTGYLHIGNARTALFNYLWASRMKGEMILRIEDTDFERSRKEYEDAVYEDLKWLGIKWNEGPDSGGKYGPYRQSERLDIYKEKVDSLLREGRAYYCFCQQDELEKRREEALKTGKPPRYDNRCRSLSQKEIDDRRARGIKPSVRFKIREGELRLTDLIRGEVVFDLSLIGDFIILRPDETPTFHLAVCVDDGLMKVTHVLRGEDHLSNTPRHILLLEAMGFRPPQYAHLSLIMGPGGSPLSKRLGARSIREYRTLGYMPEALVNYLSLLGWSPGDDREIFTPDGLERVFSIERVIKSSAIFDKDKLNWVAGQHLRRLTGEEYLARAKDFLKSDGDFLSVFKGRGDKWIDRALLLFKDSIVCFSELKVKFAFFDEAAVIEDKGILENAETRALLAEALNFLEAEKAFNEGTFAALIDSLKKKTTLKGKALYHPLRLAFTAKNEGPELVSLFPLLGRDLCIKRLKEILRK